jgi:CBS domain containing-hemolysin-like protein
LISSHWACVLSASGPWLADLVFWVALAVLVVAVAAETALRNFRWPRIEELIGAGARRDAVQVALDDERRLLDGLITLRLLSSFTVVLALLGAFDTWTGTPAASTSGDLPGRIVRVLLLFLVGLHGVVRGIVRAVPERTLLLLLGPVRVTGTLLMPVVWLTDLVGRVTCRALGLQRAPVQDEARHEILNAVSEGERGGAIDDEGREMIENIIEVQDQEVKQVMTPRTSVFAIPADTPLQAAVRLVAEQGHSRVPVYEGTIDDVRGVLYAKDLLEHWPADGQPLPSLLDVVRKPLFVPETKKTNELLNELRQDHVHVAIVLDEYGGMSGLVTIEDLLEEIVGEIEDEYDRSDEPAEVPVRRLSEHEAEVAGGVHIDDLNETLDLSLTEDDGYDTLAGFLSTRLGRVPQAGETCEFENVRFEILEADARRIHRVKLVIGQRQGA